MYVSLKVNESSRKYKRQTFTYALSKQILKSTIYTFNKSFVLFTGVILIRIDNTGSWWFSEDKAHLTLET